MVIFPLVSVEDLSCFSNSADVQFEIWLPAKYSLGSNCARQLANQSQESQFCMDLNYYYIFCPVTCIKQAKYMVFEKLKIISQHGDATLILRHLKLRKERDRMSSVIYLIIYMKIQF